MNPLRIFSLVTVMSLLIGISVSAQNNPMSTIKVQPNKKVELNFKNQHYIIEFYKDNIFRLFRDLNNGPIRHPQPQPMAKIIQDGVQPSDLQPTVSQSQELVTIKTEELRIEFDLVKNTFSVYNLKTNQKVLEESRPLALTKKENVQYLKASPSEYFYGGGAQNGRFFHKGKAINIVNENDWEDGGVASPNPFFWSTSGYAVMRNTFEKGKYDFEKTKSGEIILQHDGDVFDAFYMISATPKDLLQDYYFLTGEPVLYPKFAFYQGHLNAYNRDYWAEVNADEPSAVLFEDGKYYKEFNPVWITFGNDPSIFQDQKKRYENLKAAYTKKYKKDPEKQFRESLTPNKENGVDNYQFTAHAVVDRYLNNDMPLGWVLPNDGYGAGYGRETTLKGNIQNLKTFGDYARSKGVQIGLWTQSDLETEKVDTIAPLLQRSISQEIGTAGMRVLKTDVAWVGDGYSFGLNGIETAAAKFKEFGNNARPFIITLDGWAGTQRYGGVWTGDQVGGVWSHIDFEIPTYIGEGLSGQPNVGSDMDGIFGGGNPVVAVRDFQWKTFTPLELNMDGWGTNAKYPAVFGEPYTSINRNYLKLKSELLPYTYSIAHEATHGLPMIRAMFLEEANAYTLGENTAYQFMYGPNFLVAPIYAPEKIDEKGNDVRNGIYLPKGTWIDYFSGKIYKGGQILNDFKAPLWKLPVFVKNGAIIPMNNPNNNPKGIDTSKRIIAFYPCGQTSFSLYDDDGETLEFKEGKSTLTKIESSGPQAGEKGKVILKKT